MSYRLQTGAPAVRALAASAPCPPHLLRVICPPPTVDHAAALAREGFTPAEIAAVGALVECTDCHQTGWVARVSESDR